MLLSFVLNIPESYKITNLLPPIPFLFVYFLQLGLRRALKQCQGHHRNSGDGKVCDPRSSGWDNYHSKSKLVSWAPCLSSGLDCSLKTGWETAVASDTPNTALRKSCSLGCIRVRNMWKTPCPGPTVCTTCYWCNRLSLGLETCLWQSIQSS